MKKNYSNYSKQEYATPAVEAPIMEPLPEVVTETETIFAEGHKTPQTPVVEPESPKPEPQTGVVTCAKLNIRKLPGLNAEVAAVITKDTEVMIDPEYTTVEWYKIMTAAGVEGYCMKKFIEVK